MMRQKQKMVALLCVIGLMALLASPVFSATSGTIGATVTTQTVAMTLSPTSASYGTKAFGSVDNPPSPDSVYTATNAGDVAVDFMIRGTDAAGPGEAPWILSSSPGADAYVHKWATDADVIAGTMTTLDQQLANSVGLLGTKLFKLRMSMPTSSTDSGTYTFDTIVTAVPD